MALFNVPFDNAAAPDISAMWYAVHTRHQHEKLVARTLANKGFEVFLPLYSEVRQWRDRTKMVELPLFSCYVFLRGDLDRRLAILTTPGVHGMVATAGKLAGIPEEEIQAVRSVIESRVNVEPHPFLNCGDLVRVKYGALGGLEGFLVRKKGQARLIISVTLLERSVAAEVDASAVERLAGPRVRTATQFVSVPMSRGWGFRNVLQEPAHTASS
ncbi:MAG: UpxY family transcription antiterminator [Acidobacteria bacterium]|nr:MAG: UpxY family transcription antiterminator [Acidobacteriota bacterium]